MCSSDLNRITDKVRILNIQFPAIRYFTYYLARGILDRDNTRNITNLHLAILVAAINKDTTDTSQTYL